VLNAVFIEVFGVFVLLYVHAWRNRDVPELSAGERFDTVAHIGGCTCFAA
jgi:hypothetical protein